MAVAPLHAPSDGDFERLYSRYAPRVYRYALAVLRNPADAEDVTQTTFLNAYRAMCAGTEPERPENWLLRIAHNTCRTRFLHAARRPQEVPLDESVHQLPVSDEEKPNVEAVLKALGRLPFNQRSALVMRELEGRTYEEISAALGVSVSSVEALLFRARRSLRMRRSTLSALGTVQLPASLESFFAGGAVTTGGVVGGGVLVKAAALFVAAVTAGGAGYRIVDSSSAKPQIVPSGASSTAAPSSAVKGSASRAAASAVAVTSASLARPARSARVVSAITPTPVASASSLPAAQTPAAPQTHTAEAATAPAPAAPAPDEPVSPLPTPLAPVSEVVPALPSTPEVPVPALPTVSTPQLPALPVPEPPPLPTPPVLP